MAVTKLTNSGIKNGQLKYDSFLAGNGAYYPGDFDSITTVTVGAGGVSSITFSSIPQTYTHLQLRGLFKGGDNINANFNGDNGSNYATHYFYGSGSTVSAGGSASNPSILFGRAQGSGAYFGGFVCDILDYTNTNKYTTTRSLTGWDGNGSGEIFFESGVWMNTNAVTSIVLTGPSTISQYSSIALYGIK